MKRIAFELKTKKVMVADGAWGTFLTARGLVAGECPELWNITHRSEVLAVARAYVACGVDMIETNSFGASGLKLGLYGLAARADEINAAAASISREVAGADVHVIASIGPTGKILMMGDTSEEELYDAFRTQAIALERGGADACCIETMSAIDEAVIAVRAAKENTSLEIIAAFTFEKKAGRFVTMMGTTPREMTGALVDAGADIIGTNCGNGISGMIEIVREIRAAHASVPVIVQANAGLPVFEAGKVVYPDSPDVMASFVPALIDAGAGIIGGCCGTTPAHILAIRAAVDAHIH